MGGKAKKAIKSPEGFAGVAAAPFTGGASLALTADAAYRQKKKEEYLKRGAQKAEEANERKKELETENRRLNKQLSLSEREQKKQGLASLVGSGSDTLG